MNRKSKVGLVRQQIQALEAKITAFRTSQEFLDFLKTMCRFHRYSFHNQMMILAQKPDATRIAGFRTWKKLGRYVKRGEKGIMIFVPIICHREDSQDKDDEESQEQPEEEVTYFKTGYVFDISQTEGKPLPQISLAVEDQGAALYDSCLKLADKHGITVDVVSGLKHYGVSKGGAVLLREAANKTAMAATLIHELAHERLHQKKREQTLDKETKELEAETVAYLVCSHFGIDVPSHKYLATWQKKHQIMESLQRISQCSHEMIEELQLSETVR
jgi:antirestriction protein ArdC